jgi:RNA-directed DNA polymerase
MTPYLPTVSILGIMQAEAGNRAQSVVKQAGNNTGITPEFPLQGTCQGGVVSPLLANIALNGIEDCHKTKDTQNKMVSHAIRYADDMVIILKPEDDANKILESCSQFLAERGLKVSQKKTKLTASTEGFDFLGWHFYVQQNGKFRCVPSVDNYKAFRKKVKKIVNSSNYGASVKAHKLTPIVRGWKQYHKFCKMNGSRFSLWYLNNRAYQVFNKETKQDRQSAEKLVKQAFPKVPYSENRHVKVKGNKSPYDGDLVYWSQRNSKLYDGRTSKLFKKQNHTCGYCGHKLTSEERVHLHHIDGNSHNWKDSNLTVIHESCHDYIHMSKKEVEITNPF